MIATGEGSGTLPDLLARYAQGEGQLVSERQEMLATWIPRIVYGALLLWMAMGLIGGASLLGGRGTILGTMIGALIITILRNGGVKMGWPQYTQEIVMGVVIVVAVAIDNLRQRGRA